MGRRAQSPKGRVEAKRTPSAKSPKTKDARVRDLEKRLAEALKREALAQQLLQTRDRDLAESQEHLTATSEILRAMSGSLADVQPVFDTIVRSGLRLLGGHSATMMLLRDGDCLDLVAYTSTNSGADASLIDVFPLPLHSLPPGERAVHDRRPHAVEDVQSDPDVTNVMRETGRARGWHSNLFIPMIREDVALGLISITRRDPGPFAADEIALLQTFADQAVIAIENVRLFTELQEKNQALTEAHCQVSEALDQQTATAEILRVISSSPTNAQPVFDTIADNTMRLFQPWSVAVYRFDGALIHVAATRGGLPGSDEYLRAQGPRRPAREFMAGRCILDRSVIHVRDFERDADVPHVAREIARLRGFRATVTVPMLREEEPIGVISVSRTESGGFAPIEIELLQTFADQAVIAIENVRLFTELEARTQDLTRSVGELQALGEVGQAISSTLDLNTVLSTIVARATQLSGTDAGVIYEYDEQREVFEPRASEHLEPEIVKTMLATPVRRGEGATGQLAEVQEPTQVPDILAARAESRVRGALVRAGYRALLAVPLVREAHLLGGLTVLRKSTGGFGPEIIELLRTFATQSALAIQNARLFQEIEAKGREVQAASQHKSEFLANMSHELRTPLNAIIGYSELLEEEAADLDGGRLVPDLQKIATAAKHQLSLINDILDLSKIEAGRMELELADFHLPTMLDHALTLVRERATRRGIKLQATMDPRLGAVQGDERKIKQVVLNLLSNAIKFTPEGGQIEVSAAPRHGAVEVSVHDNGVGIAPEDQEAVFEEFRQVGTADKKVEGTGLGLALSRKFIELHGGRIWVQSQIGHGSTFTFTIPVRRGDEPIPRQ